MQFSAIRGEIQCETTTTRTMTVKPLRYISLQEQFEIFHKSIFLLVTLARFEPGGRGIQLVRAIHATDGAIWVPHVHSSFAIILMGKRADCIV